MRRVLIIGVAHCGPKEALLQTWNQRWPTGPHSAAFLRGVAISILLQPRCHHRLVARGNVEDVLTALWTRLSQKIEPTIPQKTMKRWGEPSIHGELKLKPVTWETKTSYPIKSFFICHLHLPRVSIEYVAEEISWRKAHWRWLPPSLQISLWVSNFQISDDASCIEIQIWAQKCRDLAWAKSRRWWFPTWKHIMCLGRCRHDWRAEELGGVCLFDVSSKAHHWPTNMLVDLPCKRRNKSFNTYLTKSQWTTKVSHADAHFLCRHCCFSTKRV